MFLVFPPSSSFSDVCPSRCISGSRIFSKLVQYVFSFLFRLSFERTGFDLGICSPSGTLSVLLLYYEYIAIQIRNCCLCTIVRFFLLLLHILSIILVYISTKNWRIRHADTFYPFAVGLGLGFNGVVTASRCTATF